MFFVCHNAAPLDLHSFPTRRSSDLHPLAPEHAGEGGQPIDPDGRAQAVVLVPVPVLTGKLLDPLHGSAPRELERSEEHTSELQSPYDLVCRLLLEKKKNFQNDTMYS